MDRYNPESELRRRIKQLIDDGDLETIKTLENLTPSCPYNRWGTSKSHL